MALTGIDTVNGTIQDFFEKSWMDLPQKTFLTPLANSSLLEKAVIPKGRGQTAKFRRFAHFTVETNGTDSSPKTYKENSEPSSPLVLSASEFEVPFTMLADYVEIGNVADSTDPTGLMMKAKEEFALLIRRKIHQMTNDRCVKDITETLSESDTSLVTTLPDPFPTIYAGSVDDFANLAADSYFTMEDFKRARSALENDNVPYAYPGDDLYACIVTQSIIDQLTADPDFRDMWKRHSMLAKKAGNGVLFDYEGMRWIKQNDSYRCKLPDAGGALTTRANTGMVFVAHVLGKGAMGYVDLADKKLRRTLRPTFKVLDTSKTGTGPSVGWRMAYQACVMDSDRGLNVAGTTSYYKAVSDL